MSLFLRLGQDYVTSSDKALRYLFLAGPWDTGVNFSVEQATKAQRGSRSITLLFL